MSMSSLSLRQAVKNVTEGPEGDIEALLATEAPATCSASAPCGADHATSAFPAKALHRRACALLAAVPASGAPPLTPRRRARQGLLLLGLAWAALCLSARRCDGRCRGAALRRLDEPDFRAALHAASERRYLPAAEYAAARREIDRVPDHEASGDVVFRMIARNGERDQEELRSVRAEHERLVSPRYFCGTCHWGWGPGGSVSCGQRAAFLVQAHGMGQVAGRIQAMARPSCVVAEETDSASDV